MSVILNEAALAALLETEEGPVGRFVQLLATRIVADAEQKFDDYFANANLPDQENIGFQMEGSAATIGYKDVGNKSRRLAQAEAEGKLRVPPIASAVESVRGGN